MNKSALLARPQATNQPASQHTLASTHVCMHAVTICNPCTAAAQTSDAHGSEGEFRAQLSWCSTPWSQKCCVVFRLSPTCSVVVFCSRFFWVAHCCTVSTALLSFTAIYSQAYWLSLEFAMGGSLLWVTGPLHWHTLNAPADASSSVIVLHSYAFQLQLEAPAALRIPTGAWCCCTLIATLLLLGLVEPELRVCMSSATSMQPGGPPQTSSRGGGGRRRAYFRQGGRGSSQKQPNTFGGVEGHRFIQRGHQQYLTRA